MGASFHPPSNPDPRIQRLFGRYEEAVRNKLRRCGLEGPDLEELLQAVFCIAHRRADVVPLDYPGARRWLLDVARKEAANWRKRFRHKFEMLDPHAIETAVSQPEDTEELRATISLVHQTTALLSPEDQEILLRHDAAGETLKEIAKRLGLSKSGAHLRLTQARARFIEKLEMLQGKKKEELTAVPVVALLAAVLRRAIGPESALARVPYLGPLLDPTRWAARLTPLFSGPITAVLIAVVVPGRPHEPAPAPVEPPPAVLPSPAPPPTLEGIDSRDVDCTAAKDAESPPSPHSGRGGVAPAEHPPRRTEEELLYERIVACDARGQAEEALGSIQHYQSKYPAGRFTDEVNMLQRKLLATESNAKAQLAPPM